MNDDDYYFKILDDDGVPDRVKAMAASGLRGRTDPQALARLQQALSCDGPLLKQAAAWALAGSAANLARAASDATLGADGIPNADSVAMLGAFVGLASADLSRALNDVTDADSRCQAASVILSLPHNEALDFLEGALDEEGRLGVLAASILARRRHEPAIERLVNTLTTADEPPALRWLAADALIAIANEEIVPLLVDALADHDLLAAWATLGAHETASLIDRARENSWPDLRAAGESAYRFTIANVEKMKNARIDELVGAITGHDRDAREKATHQLLAVADAGDDGVAAAVAAAIHKVIELDFDNRGVEMSELPGVLEKLPDPPAHTDLIKLAIHRDWETRRLAIEALGEVGRSDPVARQTVYDALVSDPKRYVRKAAAGVVASVAEPPESALDPLLHCVLRDDTMANEGMDDRVVKPAGHALGQLKLSAAVAPLCAALESDNAAVRRSAAWALGELNASDAFEPLRNRLGHDKEPVVRQAAAWALGQLRNPSAARDLLTAWEKERDHDDVCDQIALALGQLRSRDAVKALVATLEAKPPRSDQVRSRIIWALGEIQDVAAAPTLEGLLRDGSYEIRRRSAVALGVIRHRDSGDLILERLQEESHPQVKEAMVHAFGELQWVPARGDLEQRVQRDLEDGVKKASAQVLGVIGDAHSAMVLDAVAASEAVAVAVRQAARDGAIRIRDRKRNKAG